ncbi:TonB-dependent receptor domain-containing protein [Sphingomonas montanisoli]|uniref:TonB-dependent receptor n=1 Tax=Sphingomonas montanisoli TaxID=2606412 RepID=A0A5D9CBJ0_9SPHN|nr:TonB-dependent receptor [Sphingomonas montanisoli]TZG28603.1 TonB-dependent receptor [Sphingomonas montanisoli]
MTLASRLALSSSLALILAAPAFAEDAADADYHQTPTNDIIVSAPIQRDRMDVLANSVAISGEKLLSMVRPTIGETLQHTAGVSASSFGPNASRPILRGLSGSRAPVLTDGIGSIDVSNTSADHAVVIDPLLADRIEVVRGPEALLYDSAPLGGVVNVSDKRIPRAIPDEAFHADFTGGYGTAANERTIGGAIDAPVGGGFVVHADGSYLKTGDLDIGGHVLSRSARADALASAALPADPDADPEIDFGANAALKDKLPNSAAKTWTAGAGVAYIGDRGSFGISYGHYDSLYGIPARYAVVPGEGQEAPRLDVLQNRVDARAEIETGGDLLKSIRIRTGYAHYRHFELEEDGAIGTAFYNDGFEGRIDVVQADRGAWRGSTGAQITVRDFNVIGEEAFLPKSQTDKLAFFTLQQLDYGAFKVEGALRYERANSSASPLDNQSQFFSGKRSFDSFSGSLGASYGFDDNWRAGVNVMRTERAPTPEELFANGPHAGTEAFEIGDPAFDTERAWGVEAVLHGKGPGFTVHASAYHNWYDSFIYDIRTGALEDGLPVYLNQQGKARFYGFEAEGTLDIATIGDYTIRADALGDYIHANIKSVGPAPRIPPLRLLGGLGVESDRIDGRVEVEWVDKAQRLAVNESPTDSYTLVNASLTFHPFTGDKTTSIILSANNIFDVNARRHASFLKDFAPLAGRDFRIATRFSL